MATTVQDLVFRLQKGSPLTPQEGDSNLTILENAINALFAAIAVSLNPDGTLAQGAVSALNQIANLQLFADSFSGGESLPTSVSTANVYVVTNAAITAYTKGMRVKFKADLANVTGSNAEPPSSVQVQFNTLALTNIVKGGNVPLALNDILPGMVVELTYDGANFQMTDIYRAAATNATFGPVQLALASDVVGSTQDPENPGPFPVPTEASKVVTPVTMGAHLGVAKVVAQFHWQAGSGSFQTPVMFNVAGIVRNGTGDYTITFTTPFSSGNFSYSFGARGDGAAAAIPFLYRHNLDPGLANTIRVQCINAGIGTCDPPEVSVTCWGQQ